MTELKIEADVSRAEDVNNYVSKRLDEICCPPQIRVQICIAADEIFSNIARYAYGSGTGSAEVCVEAEHYPPAAVITFTDCGTEYDPFLAEDPDITLPAQKRGEGGLGIYIVKKLMDSVSYEYRDGMNILRLRKYFEKNENREQSH